MGGNQQYKLSRKFLGIQGHELLDGKGLPNTQHKGWTQTQTQAQHCAISNPETTIKDKRPKPRGRVEAGEGGGFGWGGEKMQTTVIEQQLKKNKNPRQRDGSISLQRHRDTGKK